MTTKKVIIMLFFTMTLVSCHKKEKPTVIEGNVKDFYTQNIIPNVILHIASRGNPTDPHIQPSIYNQAAWVDNIQVNSNGQFSYETEALSNQSYDLILINDSLISSNIYHITSYTKNTFTVLTKKLRNLKLHLINQNNIYNKAIFYIYQDPFSKSIIINGTSNDTVIFDKVIPDNSYQIHYTLTKPNNQDTSILKNFIIQNSDTITTYNITY